MWNNPDDVDGVARPVVAVGNDYPPSHELEPHHHRRGQLLYAAKGVIVVSTPQGAWAAPAERAVWIPGGIRHAVRMVGEVSTRSVLVEPSVCAALGDRCRVIAVTPLLRTLLVEACEIPGEYEVEGRDGLVMRLLMAELMRAEVLPLAAPFPAHPALAVRCRAFLERPTPHETIEAWSSELGLGRRAFTRLFRRETGMSFAEWRQQVCLLVALPRLAAGDAVTTIALDLGYESPAAFTTMVRRLVGRPPTEVRRGVAAV